MAKKWIHPKYYQGVEVVDIDGNTFTVNAAVPGPIKVESSYLTHPVYTWVKQEVRRTGMVEKYQAKLERMAAMSWKWWATWGKTAKDTKKKAAKKTEDKAAAETTETLDA